MAFALLEDATSKAEVVIFPKTFATAQEWLNQYQVFLVKGILDTSSSQLCKIKANQIIPLDLLFKDAKIDAIQLHLPGQNTQACIALLEEKLKSGDISLHIIFSENNKKIKLQSKQKIALDPHCLIELENHGIQIKICL